MKNKITTGISSVVLGIVLATGCTLGIGTGRDNDGVFTRCGACSHADGTIAKHCESRKSGDHATRERPERLEHARKRHAKTVVRRKE